MGDLQKDNPQLRYISFCLSDLCTTVYQQEVYKPVPAYVVDCPDCGHALVTRKYRPGKDNFPEPIDYTEKDFQCGECGKLFKTYLECKRHQCGL